MAGKSRSLGSLLVNVGADTRALETGLHSATASVNQFGARTAATTKKARAGFNNMSTAALGVGASMAAATGLGGLMALGPAAAGGVAMRGLNSISSPMADSLPNMMRKLKLEQRAMRFQFMGGPAGDALSNMNYFTNPGNLIEEAKIGGLEFFSGIGKNNVFKMLGDVMSPTDGVAAQVSPDSPGWNKGSEISMGIMRGMLGFGVSP